MIIKSILRIGLGALLLVACSSEAPDPLLNETPAAGATCGNGTLEVGEACDGSLSATDSCGRRGFYEGELSCTAECVVDTSLCILADEDADGLHYAHELQFGTDPTVFDSDGDGIGDGAEVDGLADPLNAYSWPEHVWPNRMDAAQADGLTPTGWGLNEVPPNVQLIDQFGEPVNLHQLYGYVVVVSVGASWCPPCKQAAQSSEELFQKYRAQGVVFVELLIEGPNGDPAVQADIDNWVASYGLTFPVTRADVDFGTSALPTFYFFDRQLVLKERQEGYGGDGKISFGIAKLAKD